MTEGNLWRRRLAGASVLYAPAATIPAGWHAAAMVSAVIGLLAALVGGVLTFAGGWVATSRQAGAQRAAARRADLLSLVADFLVETDRLWRSVDGVVNAGRLLAMSSTSPPSLAAQWREDTEERRESWLAAQRSMAVMDVIAPELSRSARALLDACEAAPQQITERERWMTARGEAKTLFIVAARAALQ